MKKMKLISSVIILGAVFFLGNLSDARAVVGDEYLKLDSKEAAISASQSEAGGEDGVSVGSRDGSFKEYKEEDPNPIPTLENATKLDIQPTEAEQEAVVPEAVAPAVVSPVEKVTRGFQDNLPYIIIIIFVVAALIAMLIFIIRKARSEDKIIK